MEQQDEATGRPSNVLTDIIRAGVCAHGLVAEDVEECVREYWRRHPPPADHVDGETKISDRRAIREARWFVTRWIHDRTICINAASLEFETPVRRNVDLETIASIVDTFTPGSRWLWRRVEIDAVGLKQLSCETGIPVSQLHYDLDKVRRAIRKELDGPKKRTAGAISGCTG